MIPETHLKNADESSPFGLLQRFDVAVKEGGGGDCAGGEVENRQS